MAVPPAPQPATTPQIPTPPPPPIHDEVHIPAGHDVAVHHKPRFWVWAIVALMVLAWIYAAVDALTETKLPVEFFKKEAKITEQTPVTQPTPQPTPTPPPVASTFELPDGWKYYENKELGFKFAHPGEWGKLIDDEGDSSSEHQVLNLKTDTSNVNRAMYVYADKLDDFKYGGGLANELSPKLENGQLKWVITDSGRFGSESDVGKEIKPVVLTSKDPIVHQFEESEGPFSSLTIFFVVKGNVVAVNLPSSCSPEECENAQESYTSNEIEDFAKTIARSVSVSTN
jgi:hypothetical protein